MLIDATVKDFVPSRYNYTSSNPEYLKLENLPIGQVAYFQTDFPNDPSKDRSWRERMRQKIARIQKQRGYRFSVSRGEGMIGGKFVPLIQVKREA